MNRRAWIPLVFGTAFGVFLAKSRATDYWAIQSLFRLEDFHIAGVMAVAIATAGLGLTLLRWRARRALSGEPMNLRPHPRQPRTFWFGLLFGTGWALTGACPGPALAALGEGRFHAVWIVLGMVLGTWAWGLERRERKPRLPQGARESC